MRVRQALQGLRVPREQAFFLEGQVPEGHPRRHQILEDTGREAGEVLHRSLGSRFLEGTFGSRKGRDICAGCEIQVRIPGGVGKLVLNPVEVLFFGHIYPQCWEVGA